MQSTLIELLFRLCYIVISYACLYTLHYFSYGWQCEYFLATFANQYQSVDYCFGESLTWEPPFLVSQKIIQLKELINYSNYQGALVTTIAKSWDTVYSTSAAYFYGLSLRNTHILGFSVLLVQEFGLVLLHAYAFVCPGLVFSKSRFIFLGLICGWFALQCFIINCGLLIFSLVEELAIERLDSELHHNLKTT